MTPEGYEDKVKAGVLVKDSIEAYIIGESQIELYQPLLVYRTRLVNISPAVY